MYGAAFRYIIIIRSSYVPCFAKEATKTRLLTPLYHHFVYLGYTFTEVPSYRGSIRVCHTYALTRRLCLFTGPSLPVETAMHYLLVLVDPDTALVWNLFFLLSSDCL